MAAQEVQDSKNFQGVIEHDRFLSSVGISTRMRCSSAGLSTGMAAVQLGPIVVYPL